MSLPSDLWAKIFEYCQGYPTRLVCRAWAKYPNVTTTACCMTSLSLANWALADGCPIGRHAMHHLAHTGQPELLYWGVSHGGKIDNEVIEDVACSGNLELLKSLVTQGHKMSFIVALNAYRRHHNEMLAWALSNGCEWVDNVLYEHPFNLPGMQWLHAAGYPITKWAYLKVVEKKRLDIFTWLRSVNVPFHEDTLRHAHDEIFDLVLAAGAPVSIETAASLARSGRINRLKQIWHPRLISSRVCSEAAASGDLDILIWVRAQGCPWGPMYFAARQGYLHILQYVYENGYVEKDWSSPAAWNGDFETLIWLRSIGQITGKDLCKSIASSASPGRLEMLKWARSYGYPWGDTMNELAENGDLRAMKWAHEHGASWSPEVYARAIMGGHRHVVEWLEANGCPKNVTASQEAAAKGDFDLLIWLRDRGFPWGVETCEGAAESGKIKVLAWLRAQGCPWDKKVIEMAYGCGNMLLLDWAIAHGCPED